MNLTEENIIGVNELKENENISLSDFVPVQKENETEIKKISLEKILLAVSKMTDEQKQVLNSALALIDDENISSEKTFSSEKINSQIETVTTSKVAEIVANAPEDFDTLKEMSDWISEHQDSASAMNTAILKNANDIATEITERKSTDKNLQSQINTINARVYPSRLNYTLNKGYTRFSFFDKTAYNGTICAELNCLITGNDVISTLNLRICGNMYTYEFGVVYDYVGYGDTSIDVYPIVIGNNTNWETYRTFGFSLNNRITIGSQTLVILSFKLNGYYHKASDYITVLDTVPTYMHENGKLTPNTMNGVIYLNKKT